MWSPELGVKLCPENQDFACVSLAVLNHKRGCAVGIAIPSALAMLVVVWVDVVDPAVIDAAVLAATREMTPVQPFNKLAANIAEHTIIRRDIISPVGRYAKGGRELFLCNPLWTKVLESVLG
jgi:hypothetical protein